MLIAVFFFFFFKSTAPEVLPVGLAEPKYEEAGAREHSKCKLFPYVGLAVVKTQSSECSISYSQDRAPGKEAPVTESPKYPVDRN